MTKFYEFQEGDIASFGGVEEVIYLTGRKDEFVIKINGYHFTRDGRLYGDHTEPLLKLVKKAKSKKTFWLWADLRDGQQTGYFYDENGLSPKGTHKPTVFTTKLEWSAQEFEVEN